MRKGQMA